MLGDRGFGYILVAVFDCAEDGSMLTDGVPSHFGGKVKIVDRRGSVVQCRDERGEYAISGCLCD